MSTHLGRALAAGTAGAVALTAINEIGRRTLPGAPRLDLLGEQAVARLVGQRARRFRPGRRSRVRGAALAGDLICNALFYALAARGRAPRPGRGLALGALAGVGAVALAPRLGLGAPPSEATLGTSALTVAWYAIGGLMAGAVARALSREEAQDFQSPYP